MGASFRVGHLKKGRHYPQTTKPPSSKRSEDVKLLCVGRTSDPTTTVERDDHVMIKVKGMGSFKLNLCKLKGN